MKTKTLLILPLMVLIFSCDSYHSGASKIEGLQGYCIWQKDKSGYQAFYSKSLPPSTNMEYKKCKNMKECNLECQKIASKDSIK